MSIDTPHLLITDDDAAFRTTLSGALEARGFRTSQAADGLETLKLVRNEQIHLILLDLQMPRLSGLETMRLLRSQVASPPWILVSGALNDEIVAQAREMFVASVLAKPFPIHEATNAVRQALRDFYSWEPQVG